MSSLKDFSRLTCKSQWIDSQGRFSQLVLIVETANLPAHAVCFVDINLIKIFYLKHFLFQFRKNAFSISITMICSKRTKWPDNGKSLDEVSLLIGFPGERWDQVDTIKWIHISAC